MQSGCNLQRGNAWRSVYRFLLRAGRDGQHRPRWPGFVDSLVELGFAAECLRQWLPSKAEQQRIAKIQTCIAQLHDPKHRRRQVPQQYLDELRRDKNPCWALLGEIASAHQPRRTAQTPATAPKTAASPTRPASTPPAQTAKRAQRVADTQTQARARLDRVKARAGSLVAGPFVTNANRLRIYIDEAWPKNRSMGILAGIVWTEPKIDLERLPLITTHLMRRIGGGKGYAGRVERRVEKCGEALDQLIGCSSCFPVVMPLLSHEKNAQKHYPQLATHALLLMLGWLIRCRAQRVKVEIFFERHAGFGEGADDTARIRGLIEGLNFSGQSRFQHVEIERVVWTNKDFEYIPYADLIAYLALEPTQHGRRVAEAVGLTDWPGYLPVSLQLTHRLLQLDELESRRSVAEVLDVCTAIAGTRLGELVEEDLRQRFEVHRSLRISLINELDRRFQLQPRASDELSRQFDVVRRLLPASTHRRSKRLKTIYAVLRPDAKHAAHDTVSIAPQSPERRVTKQLALPLVDGEP